MVRAKKGDQVVVDYVVRTGDGRVVGGTDREGPQTLTLGSDAVFAEVDDCLTGMNAGDEQFVTVPVDRAFGPRREELVVQIPRAQLPQGETPRPGMQLAARGQDGNTVNLTITEVGEEAVVADGNHPLAGEDLHFALTLVEIKDAA